MSSEQKQEGGVGDVDRQFEEKSEPQTGVGAFEFETPYGSSRYVGEWAYVGDTKMRQGKGKFSFAEKDEWYEGDWVADKMHGEGVYSFTTGSCYAGSFENGMFEGRGKYTWSDGDIYEGLWMQNKMHGRGTFTVASGTRWEGDFVNGMYKNGKGEYIDLKNGDAPTESKTEASEQSVKINEVAQNHAISMQVEETKS